MCGWNSVAENLDWNFKKTIVIFEMSTIELVKNELFNSCGEFWYRSAFSKGLGSI